ncbi:MAG: reductive dehalogenase, partial [Paracoccaceae bacterium]
MSWPHNTPTRRADDAAAGIEITDDFERFAQRNDVFTRAMWDDAVRSKKADAFFASYRMEFAPRRGDGFTQRDFALRNAAWLISDVMTNRFAEDGRREGFQAPISYDTPVADTPVEVTAPTDMSREIKQIAKFFGAGLCGITDMDDRWLYTARVDVRDMSEAPLGLPEGLTGVIVLGHEMD